MNATSRRAAEAAAARGRDLQAELASAGLSRRELARMGLVAGGSMYGVRSLSLRKAMAADPASPPTRP